MTFNLIAFPLMFIQFTFLVTCTKIFIEAKSHFCNALPPPKLQRAGLPSPLIGTFLTVPHCDPSIPSTWPPSLSLTVLSYLTIFPALYSCFCPPFSPIMPFFISYCISSPNCALLCSMLPWCLSQPPDCHLQQSGADNRHVYGRIIIVLGKINPGP